MIDPEKLENGLRALFNAGYAAAKRHSADKLDACAKAADGDSPMTYLAAAFRLEALIAEDATTTSAERTCRSAPPTLPDDPLAEGSAPAGRPAGRPGCTPSEPG